MAKDDTTMVDGLNGSPKDVDQILPPSKRHKQGEQRAQKTRHKSSNLGRVAKRQGEHLEKKFLMTKKRFDELLAAPYGPRRGSCGKTYEGSDRRDHSMEWNKVGKGQRVS